MWNRRGWTLSCSECFFPLCLSFPILLPRVLAGSPHTLHPTPSQKEDSVPCPQHRSQPCVLGSRWLARPQWASGPRSLATCAMSHLLLGNLESSAFLTTALCQGWSWFLPSPGDVLEPGSYMPTHTHTHTHTHARARADTKTYRHTGSLPTPRPSGPPSPALTLWSNKGG